MSACNIKQKNENQENVFRAYQVNIREDSGMRSQP